MYVKDTVQLKRFTELGPKDRGLVSASIWEVIFEGPKTFDRADRLCVHDMGPEVIVEMAHALHRTHRSAVHHLDF